MRLSWSLNFVAPSLLAGSQQGMRNGMIPRETPCPVVSLGNPQHRFIQKTPGTVIPTERSRKMCQKTRSPFVGLLGASGGRLPRQCATDTAARGLATPGSLVCPKMGGALPGFPLNHPRESALEERPEEFQSCRLSLVMKRPSKMAGTPSTSY